MNRSSTPSLQSSTPTRSTFISITTSLKACGAAVETTETPGGGTPTSTSTNGREDSPTWLNTYAIPTHTHLTSLHSSHRYSQNPQAKSWPAFTSIALRNEPRRPDNTTLADATYNWKYWYTYVRAGASAVSAANPDPLIFLSGLDYDTTLTPVVRKTALTPGNGTFSFADFPANKIVLELHKYGYQSVTDCASLESGLLRNGFEALDTNKPDVNHFPVVLTEWGFLMTDNTTWQKPYTQCLAQWLPAQKASWMIWVIAGSYYKRRASQDDEELWGLFNHDWSDWRNPTYIEQSFKPMVAATLS